METKKTPKANLENKRPTWLLVGYVTVLAFMFVAFEWTRDVRVDTSGRITENVFEQDMEIPLTRQPEVTPPPPPQVTPINDVLTIIDDDDTAEETNFASSEETGEDVVIKHIPVTVDEEVVVEDDIFVVVETRNFLMGAQPGFYSTWARISNILLFHKRMELRVV